ncbi:MAG: hypothetical protein HWE15_13935 [Algoriphagus sp.]|uniref:hypothetical protein n=1 Tax=Algoriphagus sp. TaxID=1872435 RepID=UPI0017D8E2F9|nr:hypothetical protein [Algoriphagus sp.]NVJ87405.1 hypothetical protein [Algoriphagus sp.]
MKFFYISSQTNPDNLFEIHERDCAHIPDAINRDYLGPFNNGSEALRTATRTKNNVTLCPNCCQGQNAAIIFKDKVSN